jgi:hypothetical protein
MTLRPKSTTLRFPPSSRSRFSDESISENSLSLAARSSMKWTFLLVARISCSWTTWRVRRHRRMATSCSMLFLPLSEAHGLCFLVSSRRAAAGMPPPALRDACRRRFHRRRPSARGPVPPRVRPAPWHHHRCLRSSLWGHMYSIDSTAAASHDHVFLPRWRPRRPASANQRHAPLLGATCNTPCL